MKRMRHLKVFCAAHPCCSVLVCERRQLKQVRERERESERERGRDSRRYFSALQHAETHTYGVGERQTRSLSKAAVVHTLCSFPPPGTERARQAALFGDSPRGKFFFFGSILSGAD